MVNIKRKKHEYFYNFLSKLRRHLGFIPNNRFWKILIDILHSV